MVDTNNHDDTLLEFEDVEDTSSDGGFELEFEDVPESRWTWALTRVSTREGVLPPLAEGMHSLLEFLKIRHSRRLLYRQRF